MTTSPTANLVCVDPRCSQAGRATGRATCASCGRPTQQALAGTTPPVRRPSGTSTVEKGLDVGSRVFYGGFWALVCVAAMLGGFATLGDNVGGGLFALLIAGLAGLYALYIFRGGRFRIMFW